MKFSEGLSRSTQKYRPWGKVISFHTCFKQKNKISILPGRKWIWFKFRKFDAINHWKSAFENRLEKNLKKQTKFHFEYKITQIVYYPDAVLKIQLSGKIEVKSFLTWRLMGSILSRKLFNLCKYITFKPTSCGIGIGRILQGWKVIIWNAHNI